MVRNSRKVNGDHQITESNVGFQVQSALNPILEIEQSLDLEHLKPSTDQVPYIQGEGLLYNVVCNYFLGTANATYYWF